MKINFSNHFQALADSYGDKEALVNIERNRIYTYMEYHKLTNKIINMMMDKLQLGLGDRYINILENDNLALLHFPTIFKGPATGIFSNYRDSKEEQLWQIDYAKPKVAFIENCLLPTHLAELQQRGVTVVCMDPMEEVQEGVLYFWDLLEKASDENPNIELDDREHMALIRFTGGTTGKGKPAVYCIDNWLGCRDSFYALPDHAWTSESRLLHLAPISHGSGLFYLPAFYAGSCNLTQNEPDLVKYCMNIEKEKITNSFLVPTILYRLLEISDVEHIDLSSLQFMFYGAAPMSPSKLKQLQERLGNIFIQVYGSTEHFGIAMSLSRAAHEVETEEEVRLSSAGQATAGIEVRVMDDNGKPLSTGEIGEFWLRSRSVCMGYLDNPEKTAEEFVNGYWKSGDVGYFDEKGFGYIVDRKKDIIISGGFNVYATEVEAAISSHEAVLLSVAVGIPHKEWGEAVHAEVVLRQGAEITEQELIDYVKGKLSRYKVPKSLKIVSEILMTAAGKVLRRAVREAYWMDEKRKVA